MGFSQILKDFNHFFNYLIKKISSSLFVPWEGGREHWTVNYIGTQRFEICL